MSILDQDLGSDHFQFVQHITTSSRVFTPNGDYTRLNGNYFYGTSGDDLIRPQAGHGVYVGGGGNDAMSAPNDHADRFYPDRLYGDEISAGFPGRQVGGRYGNDTLEGGGGDILKSGRGHDTYVYHDETDEAHAMQTWGNWSKDTFVFASRPEVTAFTVSSIDRAHHTATMQNLTLEDFTASGGLQKTVQHWDPSNANLDTGSWTISYTGSACDLGDVNRAFDRWDATHDGFLA